jgi:type IV pilus assembly protein PilN
VRLNINLASRPYLDTRSTLTRWGVPVLLLAACTLVLLWAAASSWLQAREMDRKIAGLNSEIASLEDRQNQALELLRLPKNRSTIETSRFLNGLIARKAFSWTRAFMELEKILPPKLRVVSISPHLQPESNAVKVSLTVAGHSRDAAVELVKRLEQSPSFRDPRIVEESTVQEKDSADTVMFRLEATYVAAPAAPSAAAPAGKAADSKASADEAASKAPAALSAVREEAP